MRLFTQLVCSSVYPCICPLSLYTSFMSNEGSSLSNILVSFWQPWCQLKNGFFYLFKESLRFIFLPVLRIQNINRYSAWLYSSKLKQLFNLLFCVQICWCFIRKHSQNEMLWTFTWQCIDSLKIVFCLVFFLHFHHFRF